MFLVPLVLGLVFGATFSEAQWMDLQPKQSIVLEDGELVTIEVIDPSIYIVEDGNILRIGGDSSGGGDFVAQEVSSVAKWIISQLDQVSDPEIKDEARMLATRFRGLIDELKIVVVHRLMLDSTEVSAINQPDHVRLFISRQLWVEQTSYHDKTALILHELFGLAGLPDQNYSLSNIWSPVISRDYSALRPTTHSGDEHYQDSKEAILACAPRMKAHARELAEKLGPYMDSENLDVPFLMEPGSIQKIIDTAPRDSAYKTNTVRDITPERGRYAEANGDECVMTAYPNTYTVTCTTSVIKDGAKPWEAVIPQMKLRYFYQRESKTCLPVYYAAGRQYFSKRPPYLELPHLDYLESAGAVYILRDAVRESVNGMHYVEDWKRSTMVSWVRSSGVIPAYLYKKKGHEKSLLGKTVKFNFDYVEYKPEPDKGPFFRRRDSCPRTNCSYRLEWAGAMAGFLSNVPEQEGLSRLDEMFLSMVYDSSVHWEGPYPDLVSPEAIAKAEAFYSHRGIHDRLPGPIADAVEAQKQRNLGFASRHTRGFQVTEDKGGMRLPGESVGQWTFIPKGSEFKVVDIEIQGELGYSSSNEFAYKNPTRYYAKITLTLSSPSLGTLKYGWGGGDYVYGEEVFVPFYMKVIDGN